MKIAILGFGREGQATLRFLRKKKLIGKKDEVYILDLNTHLKLPPGTRGILGSSKYLASLEQFDIVYRAPGIPYNRLELRHARAHGMKVSSLTKLFFQYCPAPIVGITGTKGKGTTATLIHKILKAAGRDSHLVGNIGVPALDVLPRIKKNSIVVYELSSFQLQDLTQSPHLAAVLEMFPDHQSSDIQTALHGTHASFKEYIDAKTNICRYQTSRDRVFFLAHNAVTRRIATHGRGKKIPITEKGFTLFAQHELKIPGLHNYRNAIVAARIAQELGVADARIRSVALRYRGLEHRLELVRKLETRATRDRIEFYNDSQSTSAQPTIAAINAFPDSDNILIAGGYDKELPYEALAQALQNSSVRLLVLMGSNRKKILAAIRKNQRQTKRPLSYEIEEVGSLSAAVKTAYAFARSPKLLKPVRRVILSPATSSFDMFASYEDRGRQFKKIVRELRI